MTLTPELTVALVVGGGLLIGLIAAVLKIRKDGRPVEGIANPYSMNPQPLPREARIPATPPRSGDFTFMHRPVLHNGGWRGVNVSFLNEHYNFPPGVTEAVWLGPGLSIEIPEGQKVVSIAMPIDDLLGYAVERARQLLAAGDADGALRVLSGEVVPEEGHGG